ncbi:hypothetical protein OIU80_16345 [Flavobacterium sp. LS1R47]|uniref:Uncharacterized protein n=1 Tax=Flavobacterium frigoritolerans TaxID=2987686 RepID=A0A9X3C930_9FLAO|nr:hypothetical protein [Flavobacterium frigoritolerans]MCV9933855.1 hypothetical protein [Flavobacterium frigoritolerans]
MEYKDNIKFIDRETKEQLIFNSKTWISVIQGIIIKYVKKNEQEAKRLIEAKKIAIPETYEEVVFYSHETEFHWAMLITYGDGYWQRGISSDEPSDYTEWESQYRIDNSLKEESFEFID